MAGLAALHLLNESRREKKLWTARQRMAYALLCRFHGPAR